MADESIEKGKKKRLKKDRPKKLEEYKQARPPQLSLFELLHVKDKPYSETIELYDFMPKYHRGKIKKRINGQFLPSLKREFECNGVAYKLTLTPARIESKDGKEKDCYPGEREELIEDALRKIAVEGQSVFLDDVASVTFTFYQLQQELKRMAHSYSYAQIKEALYVCAKTNLEVKTEDGSTAIIANMFESLGLQTKEEWQGTGKKTRCFVRFNPLVTKAIQNETFRRVNYEKTMQYCSGIARQLHKRMSHYYRQASLSHQYSILLSTIIRDFGIAPYGELRKNLAQVRMALEEMKKAEAVLSYEIEQTLDAKRHNKLLDAKISIITHPSFNSEITEENQRRQRQEKHRLSLPPAGKLFNT